MVNLLTANIYLKGCYNGKKNICNVQEEHVIITQW
jgi:hypothetical protein